MSWRKYNPILFLSRFWFIWYVLLTLFSGFVMLFCQNLLVYKRESMDTFIEVLHGNFDLLLPLERWYDAYDERFVCYTTAVEKHAEKFYNEFMVFHNMSFLEENDEDLIATGKWEFFNIMINKKLFPRASNFIQRWMDFYGLADIIEGIDYSSLDPGTHLSSHHGPSNLRVTIQVPIYVPSMGEGEGECMAIYFGKDKNTNDLETNKDLLHVWKAGELFLFNDAYRHSAWNYLKEKRSIVMINVNNPLSYAWWPWRVDSEKCPLIAPGLLRCEKTCASRKKIYQGKEDSEGCVTMCEEQLWSSEYHECIQGISKGSQGRGVSCQHLLKYDLPTFNKSERWKEPEEMLPEYMSAYLLAVFLKFIRFFDVLELIYFQEESWVQKWDWHLGKNCPTSP